MNSLTRTLLPFLLSATLALLLPAQAADAPRPRAHVPTYTVTVLGTLPDYASSFWQDLNDLGQAAGESYTSSYNPDTDTAIVHAHACLYRGGKLIDVGALIDPNANSDAVAVNIRGDVAGFTWSTAPVVGLESPPSMGFIYASGSIQTFKAFNSAYTVPTAINDLGQVVGSFKADDGYHGFLRQPTGEIVDLGTLGGDSITVADINDRGQIVGAFLKVSPTDGGYIEGPWEAFLIQPGAATPINLGSFGQGAAASAINNRGQVTGWSWLDAPTSPAHAFRYERGALNDLGVIPGGTSAYPQGINDWGQIVGYGDDSAEAVHGFVSVLDQIFDLNGLLSPPNQGLTISRADRINDRGQILGSALDAQGQSHGVILTPQAASLSPLY